jgi:hypothetical protein
LPGDAGYLRRACYKSAGRGILDYKSAGRGILEKHDNYVK